MQSKGNKVLELFFNQPTKHWHFEEILKKSKVSRDKANKWLKKFIKENIIKKIKKKTKMPHYIGNYKHPEYKNRKRLFTLNQFYKSGFLNHLQSLKKAKTVIIFGSMSRSDWHKESDIDLFIFGNDDGLNLGKYELKLHRDIQLFTAKIKKDLKKMGSGLIRNILEGYRVKGNIDFLEVKYA